MNTNLASIRSEYKSNVLVENDIKSDPLSQFKVWFMQALKAEIPEINAANLSTVGLDGKPSGRIILLKGLENSAFRFFTNYESRKAKELASNNNAALTFFWIELERQIRIEGTIDKISRDDSVSYFQSRPRESQIGAWASLQSSVVSERHSLDKEFEKYSTQFSNQEIPCPTHWGGFELVPSAIEFWQGRPGRLHDRIIYKLVEGKWTITRLAP